MQVKYGDMLSLDTSLKVAVIILSWNRWQDTLECLASLQSLDYPSIDVIIVDNASTDGSPERIRRESPNATVILNAVNLGFAAANNIGIETALDHGAAYILLLNNDTVVDRAFLTALISFAEEQPRAGVLGPKILSYTHPERIWFAGPKRSWIFGRPLELGHQGFGEIDNGKYDQARSVGFISGCALLLRREVIERVGLLDEDFFAYFEDADYCLRAAEAGYLLFYVPAARIWHKASSSAADADSYSAMTVYLGIRNRLLFMRKHGSLFGWFIFIPGFCAVVIRTLLVFGCRGGIGVLRPVAQGIADFLAGRIGSGSASSFGSTS